MFISSCFLRSGQIALWSPLVAQPIAMLWYDRKLWMSCRVVIRKYWIEFLRFLLLIQCKDGGLFKARRRRQSVIIFNQKEQNTLHSMSCYGSPWRARVVNFTAFTKTLYMIHEEASKWETPGFIAAEARAGNFKTISRLTSFALFSHRSDRAQRL